jgi:hypothetical protein
LAGFLNWTKSQLEEIGDCRPIFVSRDTEILADIWKKTNQINAHHLKCSRASLGRLTADKKLTQNVVTSKSFTGTISDFFCGRLGLTNSQTEEMFGKKLSELGISLPDDSKLVIELIESFAEKDSKSRKRKIELLRGDISPNREDSEEKIVIIDIGYSGTLQFLLKQIVPEVECGLYLMSDDSNLGNLNLMRSGWLVENQEWGKSKILDNSLRLELLLQASCGPTLDYFTSFDYLQPILGLRNNAQENFRDLRIIQQAAVSRAVRLLNECDSNFVDELARKCSSYLLENTNPIIQTLGANLDLDDPYSGPIHVIKQLRKFYEPF